MSVLVILFFATCFLAYANGANDNFKGVATLFGSGTTNYERAIWWATGATFIGSVCSLFLAEALVSNFSGKGLVPDTIAASPDFLLAVATGAGTTVIFAALIGIPVSTTHGLTGALVGAGFSAVGMNVNFSLLGNSFFLPLLLSPLIAIVLATLSYLFLRHLRLFLGITKEMCFCVGDTEKVVSMPQPASALSLEASRLNASIDTEENCYQRYRGRVFGLRCQKLLDAAHYLSAGVVSFARGLNDTPKIVALLVSIKALQLEFGMLMVGTAMAAGGLLNARRVANTISKKITPMNHGQGFTANLVTGFLVIFASRLGMPVSTTHVSVGSLFGIGMITRKADIRVITEILLSWFLTLPVAAVLGGLIYWSLSFT